MIARIAIQDGKSRALHPCGIVAARMRFGLGTQLRIRVPDIVEEYKDDADLVFACEVEKTVDALEKAFLVLIPQEIVKIDAYDVEAESSGPAEFAFDREAIKGRFLPHFELVDCCTWNEIAADEPGLLVPPRRRSLYAPHD